MILLMIWKGKRYPGIHAPVPVGQRFANPWYTHLYIGFIQVIGVERDKNTLNKSPKIVRFRCSFQWKKIRLTCKTTVNSKCSSNRMTQWFCIRFLTKGMFAFWIESRVSNGWLTSPWGYNNRRIVWISQSLTFESLFYEKLKRTLLF